jgi:hypothetical protein
MYNGSGRSKIARSKDQSASWEKQKSHFFFLSRKKNDTDVFGPLFPSFAQDPFPAKGTGLALSYFASLPFQTPKENQKEGGAPII